MDDLMECDISTLQQKLKESKSYEERGRIRKALHKKQLRGVPLSGGRSRFAVGAQSSKSQPSSQGRASPTSSSRLQTPKVGLLGESSSASSTRSQPDRRGLRNDPAEPTREEEKKPAQSTYETKKETHESEQANETNIETDEPSAPPASLDLSDPSFPSNRRTSDVLREVSASASAHASVATIEEKHVPAPTEPRTEPEKTEEVEEEPETKESLEKKLEQTRNYREKRRLRERIRQLGDAELQARAKQQKEDDQQLEAVAKNDEPAAGSKTEEEIQPRRQPEMSETRGERTAEISKKKPDDAGEEEEDEYEDDDDDEEEEYSDEEESVGSSSWKSKPNSQIDSSVNDALSKDEGVSDFRSVLRKSAAPTRVGGSPTKSTGADQKDFRQVLHKTDAPSRTMTDQKPRQEDFRGHLKKGVQTKDCSSAAPRRKAAPQQEDFRGLLHKPADKNRDQEITGNPSPEEEVPAPPPPEDGTFVASPEAEETPEDKLARQLSQPPPPVKTKPKLNRGSRIRSSSPDAGNTGNGDMDEVERLLTTNF